MVMMDGFASCLIKVRQHHIGFPSLFSHYPEGMKHEELTELHEYVQNAMDQTRDIPEANGNTRRVVIGTGKYLIMGISGYANHLAAEAPNVPYELVDFRRRSCPGFIGFVWDLEKTPVLPVGFPSLSAFGSVFYELILKHWEDSKNSPWAYQTREGVKVPYQYSVSTETLTMPTESLALNHTKKKIFSFDRSKEQTLLYVAISEALKKQTVSICTDLYLNSEEGSNFLNMTADHKGGSVEEIENVKYARSKPVQRHTGVSHDNSGTNYTSRVALEPEHRKNSEHRAEKSTSRVMTATKRFLGQFGVDITSNQYSNVVTLVVLLESGDEAVRLLNQLISRITATIMNPPYNYEAKLLYEDFNPLAQKYEVAVVIPESMSIFKFRELCQHVLEDYYKKGFINVDNNGRCWVKTNTGDKPFHVFIMELSGICAAGEILLNTAQHGTGKQATSQQKVFPKRSERNKKAEPQVDTDNDLIQHIKQKNMGQTGRKTNSDDDPFKCFD